MAEVTEKLTDPGLQPLFLRRGSQTKILSPTFTSNVVVILTLLSIVVNVTRSTLPSQVFDVFSFDSSISVAPLMSTL